MTVLKYGLGVREADEVRRKKGRECRIGGGDSTEGGRGADWGPGGPDDVVCVTRRLFNTGRQKKGVRAREKREGPVGRKATSPNGGRERVEKTRFQRSPCVL